MPRYEAAVLHYDSKLTPSIHAIHFTLASIVSVGVAATTSSAECSFPEEPGEAGSEEAAFTKTAAQPLSA